MKYFIRLWIVLISVVALTSCATWVRQGAMEIEHNVYYAEIHGGTAGATQENKKLMHIFAKRVCGDDFNIVETKSGSMFSESQIPGMNCGTYGCQDQFALSYKFSCINSPAKSERALLSTAPHNVFSDYKNNEQLFDSMNADSVIEWAITPFGIPDKVTQVDKKAYVVEYASKNVRIFLNEEAKGTTYSRTDTIIIDLKKAQ